MSFLVSAGVQTNEVDRTNIIPATSTSIGAYAGQFRKGPVGEAVLISSEKELATRFGAPTNPNAPDAASFFTAASFLRYGNALWVSRALPAGAFNAQAGGISVDADRAIDRDAEFVTLNDDASVELTAAVYARTPGAFGNSIRVEFAHADSGFSSQTYTDLFANEPTTSTFAAARGIVNDELNVLIIDEDGEITGTPGTTLETFEGVSVLSDAKADDGSNNYAVDVILARSEYIYLSKYGFKTAFGGSDSDSADSDAMSTFGQTANEVIVGSRALTDSADSQINFHITVDGATAAEASLLQFSLTQGDDGTASVATAGEITTALAIFDNPEEIEINLLFSQTGITTGEQETITTKLYSIANARKDLVVFISPYTDVTTRAQVKTFFDTLGSNSYAVFDSGPGYTFNKYADQYLYIPLCGHIAGLCARTDETNDAWFSPAGFNRGQLSGITKLKINPAQADRDVLYKARINPVVAFPGQGIVLYGDKTAQTKASAFDRINVRRLFVTLEKAISTASKYQLFEFNDEFTRAMFKNMVEPFLRDVKGRRGITDFEVVCDTTNNTGVVIDSNRFIADIYIQPARSINYITLNFIATRTGVEFSEIVGRA